MSLNEILCYISLRLVSYIPIPQITCVIFMMYMYFKAFT